VLIILPTRQSCVKYVDTIVAFAEPEQQENKKRFQDFYIIADDHFSENKPEDFRELFGGNDDDMFRIGLKFTRKTIKYFAQFYNSDIIFASPLGLRMALGSEGSKKKDNDFLSSIEIVIVDQGEALAMQNWEHMEYIFDHLNLQPKEAHGCDFGRVRTWYLDNNARFLRQTILISAFNFPSLNRLYTHHMLNVAGKVKYRRDYEGTILDLGIPLKQRFSRYETASTVADPDDRFNYFTTAIVPSLAKHSNESGDRKHGVLIYLPLYADFVRVRNYLSTSPAAQSISFGSISEYTSIKDVTRARSHFSSGRHSVLLYTERAHHFRRYSLKGVKAVIMYGLPENPLFYKEIVGGFLGSNMNEATRDSNSAYVRSLFSRLDVLKLERVVGTKRFASLLKDRSGDTFDFV
jgi:U3 small nucleolar RNA-associated protein 25